MITGVILVGGKSRRMGTDKAFVERPLFALYRKSCLESMRRLLEQGNYRVYDFYPEVNFRLVDTEELSMVGDCERSLRNINTPDEYAMLKEES